VRAGLRERALTGAARATVIELVPQEHYPRLRGAAALVAMPAFAALVGRVSRMPKRFNLFIPPREEP
jgi:hypothetical protein